MVQEPLLAAAQLVSLRIRDWNVTFLLRDAVPKIFDQLETFSPAQFEERCEFSVHA